tara:strand:- start:670 stop:855 length:186 start_codon:yes stop_codon:yes gene_type:complete
MIGNTCISPDYENILISKNIRYEKCFSKSGKLWLKIYPYDEEKHFDFFHLIDTYVSMVLED